MNPQQPQPQQMPQYQEQQDQQTQQQRQVQGTQPDQAAEALLALHFNNRSPLHNSDNQKVFSPPANSAAAAAVFAAAAIRKSSLQFRRTKSDSNVFDDSSPLSSSNGMRGFPVQQQQQQQQQQQHRIPNSAQIIPTEKKSPANVFSHSGTMAEAKKSPVNKRRDPMQLSQQFQFQFQVSPPPKKFQEFDAQRATQQPQQPQQQPQLFQQLSQLPQPQQMQPQQFLPPPNNNSNNNNNSNFSLPQLPHIFQDQNNVPDDKTPFSKFSFPPFAMMSPPLSTSQSASPSVNKSSEFPLAYSYGTSAIPSPANSNFSSSPAASLASGSSSTISNLSLDSIPLRNSSESNAPIPPGIFSMKQCPPPSDLWQTFRSPQADAFSPSSVPPTVSLSSVPVLANMPSPSPGVVISGAHYDICVPSSPSVDGLLPPLSNLGIAQQQQQGSISLRQITQNIFPTSGEVSQFHQQLQQQQHQHQQQEIEQDIQEAEHPSTHQQLKRQNRGVSLSSILN
eukprot:TRINITY_DN390_c0_g2_i3.p1 TRINITY_DN390_c0_g2~~TRINITY_DN390_c0_g2_i3.p1  ORF type:complete len:506 (+),score=156.24 TRINITY_DN390_c0_g2_i3:148-1665(+)